MSIVAGPGLAATKPSGAGLWQVMGNTIVFGVLAIVVFIGAFGFWAATAPLSSGAIAVGIVSTDSNTKLIQHLEGGIIGEIHVREGDRVHAGDPLITLTSVGAESRFATRRQQWLRLNMVRARLEAHTGGRDHVAVPPEVAEAQDPAIKSFVANQLRLFETQRRSLTQKSEITGRQIEQLRSEADAIAAQNVGLRSQIALLNTQLTNSRRLLDQQLIAEMVVLDLERDLAELQSAVAANEARIARTSQNVEEVRLSQLQAEEAFRIQVSDETTQVNNDIAFVEGDMTSSGDVLARTEITSPVDGIVQNFQNQTIGGIVRGGEPIMEIVPVDDDLIILARLAPKDIDLLEVGLPARVSLAPFASRNLMPLEGRVIQIAADTTVDQVTRMAYYEFRVRIPAEELAKQEGIYLSPGMPADITVVTGERTMLQYLAEPFRRSLQSAFVYD